MIQKKDILAETAFWTAAAWRARALIMGVLNVTPDSFFRWRQIFRREERGCDTRWRSS